MGTNMKAYYYLCPVCFSKKNESCTRPTENGRVYVTWVHLKREDLIPTKEE